MRSWCLIKIGRKRTFFKGNKEGTLSLPNAYFITKINVSPAPCNGMGMLPMSPSKPEFLKLLTDIVPMGMWNVTRPSRILNPMALPAVLSEGAG